MVGPELRIEFAYSRASFIPFAPSRCSRTLALRFVASVLRSQSGARHTA
jgi:hypothetical protein